MFQLVKQRSFVDVKVEQSSAKGRGVEGVSWLIWGEARRPFWRSREWKEGQTVKSGRWDVERADSVVLSVIVRFIWSRWKGHGGLPTDEWHDLNIFYISLVDSVNARCIIYSGYWVLCVYVKLNSKSPKTECVLVLVGDESVDIFWRLVIASNVVEN